MSWKKRLHTIIDDLKPSRYFPAIFQEITELKSIVSHATNETDVQRQAERRLTEIMSKSRMYAQSIEDSQRENTVRQFLNTMVGSSRY
ncbi:hypothetical protein [Ktedonospora formicarum]|uniref:Uncharacterized protein n=1 Tax=Ktedonospora formicarum TaxID=2778364 RepID=A0A8J3I457_9CHLR|nr:hypothetical protein [Ktedonospora formicarum]GHO44529.1 hypothetical protein KSX_26920 [Ktedonospora formicarum]